MRAITARRTSARSMRWRCSSPTERAWRYLLLAKAEARGADSPRSSRVAYTRLAPWRRSADGDSIAGSTDGRDASAGATVTSRVADRSRGHWRRTSPRCRQQLRPNTQDAQRSMRWSSRRHRRRLRAATARRHRRSRAHNVCGAPVGFTVAYPRRGAARPLDRRAREIRRRSAPTR